MKTWTAPGQRLPHLARPLDLDLEHERPRTATACAVDLGSQRAVAVAGVLGVLDELPGLQPPSNSSAERKW